LLLSNISGDINSAINHISNQQALIGSQLNKATQQVSVLGERKIAVSEEVSEMGDADLASLVTRLQSLLLSRDASQQAFAKIGQQSLFDFMR
jgi:flagellar hook-associated protein 3 FlgL